MDPHCTVPSASRPGFSSVLLAPSRRFRTPTAVGVGRPGGTHRRCLRLYRAPLLLGVRRGLASLVGRRTICHTVGVQTYSEIRVEASKIAKEPCCCAGRTKASHPPHTFLPCLEVGECERGTLPLPLQPPKHLRILTVGRLAAGLQVNGCVDVSGLDGFAPAFRPARWWRWSSAFVAMLDRAGHHSREHLQVSLWHCHPEAHRGTNPLKLR